MGHPLGWLCSSKEKLLNVVGVSVTLFLFYVGPLTSLYLCSVLLSSSLSPLFLVYLTWMVWDRHTPHREGRRLLWVRKLWIYKRFADYFPQKLVKTVELSPSENYLLCIFPHGILCTAGFAHFLSAHSDFYRLFPGLAPTFHTLNSNFYYPFLREYTLASGFLAVSKEAILHQVTNRSGRALGIFIGGSAEAMVSQPGTHRVILKNRKGFIKLALVTGTNLVPLYSFGETDLYDQWIFPEHSWVHKFQQSLRRLIGIAPVLANGGGFFQQSFGLLPRPKPVHTIVGKPIKVKRNANPTKEEIDQLHGLFMAELINLFEEHKYKYVKNPETVHLSIEE